ncbi:MAG: nuclear transport factor 2 family protein [Pseudomonadota bacterium]|nr:nuclear transport factor 2 family protein [Pseudomonadota bacterium]|tara:strand:+ start:959 stop:1417 length:459 start_codon:yes stop_codon:yes gene_type:complete
MNDTLFDRILRRFTSAVESGDGQKLAELFTEDGVYNDCFYGAFHGRDAIARMLEMHFWGHAEEFRWQMFEPIANSGMGYARYRFSYVSKLEGAEGERVVFEGMSQFTLDAGLIRVYREEFNTGIAISQLNFPAERIARHLARKADRVRAADI